MIAVEMQRASTAIPASNFRKLFEGFADRVELQIDIARTASESAKSILNLHFGRPGSAGSSAYTGNETVISHYHVANYGVSTGTSIVVGAGLDIQLLAAIHGGIDIDPPRLSARLGAEFYAQIATGQFRVEDGEVMRLAHEVSVLPELTAVQIDAAIRRLIEDTRDADD